MKIIEAGLLQYMHGALTVVGWVIDPEGVAYKNERDLQRETLRAALIYIAEGFDIILTEEVAVEKASLEVERATLDAIAAARGASTPGNGT